MDSSAAIQALSQYSISKHNQSSVALTSQMSSSSGLNYTFNFTSENAIIEKNAKVTFGKDLEIKTEGQGLGQMQVNLEYHVPTDKNENCNFNLTIVTSITEPKSASESKDGDLLCYHCGVGCKPNSSKKGKRQKRSTRNYSIGSICITLCLQHQDEDDSDQTTIEIDMITGYSPLKEDLDTMTKTPEVLGADYKEDSEKVVVFLSQVPSDSFLCLTFRARTDESAEKVTPGLVSIKKTGTREPSCFKEYTSPFDPFSLQVICADPSDPNMGECKCFSGACAICGGGRLDVQETKDLICEKDEVYKVGMFEEKAVDRWLEINATVLAVKKSVSNTVQKEQIIKMVTVLPKCTCPKDLYNETNALYFISPSATTLMDKNGNKRELYLLDQETQFHLIDEKEYMMDNNSIDKFRLETALSEKSRKECDDKNYH